MFFIKTPFLAALPLIVSAGNYKYGFCKHKKGKKKNLFSLSNTIL